jgi:hypothetical protein
MSYRISLRLAVAILTGATLFPLTVLGQSQDQPSVADAARRAREQRKAAAKQPSPVITDDTLKRSAPSDQDASAPAAQQPSAAAIGSSQAEQPSPDAAGAPNGNAAAALAEKPGAAGGDTDQKTQVSAELTALKQQVEEAQKGLELVQRELALQQDTYFSNPDHARDTAGKAKLEGTQQQAADKQQEVNALKAQLATLLGSSGSTPPTPPATPPQS